MRLNKKWLAYGATIGLVAALTTLGIVQAQQMGEKTSLSEELETVEYNLSMLEAGGASFGQQGSGTQAGDDQNNFDNARTILSRTVDSIIASEALFNIAEASSVTLTAISVSPFYDDVLAELPCSYLPLYMSVEGNEPALLDFISRLNVDLTNGLVRSVMLSVPETAEEGEATADIEIVIYTYQGE